MILPEDICQTQIAAGRNTQKEQKAVTEAAAAAQRFADASSFAVLSLFPPALHRPESNPTRPKPVTLRTAVNILSRLNHLARQDVRTPVVFCPPIQTNPSATNFSPIHADIAESAIHDSLLRLRRNTVFEREHVSAAARAELVKAVSSTHMLLRASTPQKTYESG
ncbi:hypothetical protein CPB85DRAFT_1256015 [Mucidula mucida]|nr:hypothetical protein CPB85DRAFT_1256015 [Mucidula mucida]